MRSWGFRRWLRQEFQPCYCGGLRYKWVSTNLVKRQPGTDPTSHRTDCRTAGFSAMQSQEGGGRVVVAALVSVSMTPRMITLLISWGLKAPYDDDHQRFLTMICVSKLPRNEKSPSFTPFACSTFKKACAKTLISASQGFVMSQRAFSTLLSVPINSWR